MKEASEYVEKKRAAGLSALSLMEQGASVASRLELEQNAYKVGQRWKVRVTLPVMSQALKEPVERSAAPVSVDRVLEYKVVAVKGAVATVEIASQDEPRAMRIKIDERRQVLSAEGALQLGGVGQFPVTVPRFNDAQARVVGEAIEYESEDALSRPVRVVWRKGDPWPTEMRSRTATAVLIEGGRR